MQQIFIPLKAGDIVLNYLPQKIEQLLICYAHAVCTPFVSRVFEGIVLQSPMPAVMIAACNGMCGERYFYAYDLGEKDEQIHALGQPLLHEANLLSRLADIDTTMTGIIAGLSSPTLLTLSKKQEMTGQIQMIFFHLSGVIFRLESFIGEIEGNKATLQKQIDDPSTPDDLCAQSLLVLERVTLQEGGIRRQLEHTSDMTKQFLDTISRLITL